MKKRYTLTPNKRILISIGGSKVNTTIGQYHRLVDHQHLPVINNMLKRITQEQVNGIRMRYGNSHLEVLLVNS